MVWVSRSYAVRAGGVMSLSASSNGHPLPSPAFACQLSCRREAAKEAPVAIEVRIKNSAGDDAADDQSRLPKSCIVKNTVGSLVHLPPDCTTRIEAL